MNTDLHLTVKELIESDSHATTYTDYPVILSNIAQSDSEEFDFVWSGSYHAERCIVKLPKHKDENDLIFELPKSLSDKRDILRNQVKNILKYWD